MRILKKLAELTKPYWPRVAAGIIVGLMLSAVTGAIAWLVKPALDVVFVEKRYEWLKVLPFGIFFLFCLKGLLEFAQTYLMRSAGLKLVKDMQDRLHAHILTLPAAFFHLEASGIIVSRVINDVRVLSALFSEVIKTIVVQIPTILVLLGVALYRKWDLTILSILLVPVIAYSTRKIGKRVKGKSLDAQRKLADITQRIGETITGARVIKIFNQEENRNRKFMAENRRAYRENIRVVRLKETAKFLIDIVTGLAIALLLWYGGNQVRNGIITPGDFASVIAAIYMIFSPVKKTGEAYTFLQEIRAALERIDTLLRNMPEENGSVVLRDFSAGISFRNVSFSYASHDIPVLKDVNLDINVGDVVAIVGPSGSGKTTLVDMIPRFYDPTEGSIRIDGQDLKTVDLSSLRGLIGIVSQDIILFNDTIAENIAFGKRGATAEEIKRAAQMAYADEFIDKLPEGYGTVIGERGLTLSGGQRQRLAIARAVLKNPPILILDEATSSLDTVSEAMVQEALERLMKNRTTIIIAHRISTIRNVGKIIVLKDGQIRDVGTHRELLERGGIYAELCSGMG
jgi:subfamily B ATP-binding cassette protein MsbA